MYELVGSIRWVFLKIGYIVEIQMFRNFVFNII